MITYASGFCPTQNCQYTIELEYESVGNHQYLQTGATCDYIAFDFSKCPIYKQCPIRNAAPKTKICP